MKPHGRFDIAVVGNVLVVTSEGDFNAQGSQKLSNSVLASSPLNQPWAILSILRDWEMASESALRRHAEFRELWFGRGCANIACVMRDDLRQTIHQKFAVKTPSDKVRYFETIEQACVWLSDSGFAITAKDIVGA